MQTRAAGRPTTARSAQVRAGYPQHAFLPDVQHELYTLAIQEGFDDDRARDLTRLPREGDAWKWQANRWAWLAADSDPSAPGYVRGRSELWRWLWIELDKQPQVTVDSWKAAVEVAEEALIGRD